MSKRGLTLAGMFGLAVLVLSAPATAAGETEHHWAGTARVALIEQSEGFPNVGSSVDAAGVLENRVDGGRVMRGATVIHLTVTGGDLATGLEYNGNVRWLFPQGSIKLRETGLLTLQADSSVSSTGELEVSGGTGAFRGAAGTVAYNVFSPTPTAVAVGEGAGTISY
jgi:hypothetical protein